MYSGVTDSSVAAFSRISLSDGLVFDRQAIKMRSGPVSLVFERSPPPLQLQAVVNSAKEILFNSGRVAVSTWNPRNMVSACQPDSEDYGGNVGFAVFSSRLLMPRALKALATITGGGRMASDDEDVDSKGWLGGDSPFEIIASFSDEEESEEELEWTHGDFSLEDYNKALARARYDLTYNHRQGMNYSKVGSAAKSAKMWMADLVCDKVLKKGGWLHMMRALSGS